MLRRSPGDRPQSPLRRLADEVFQAQRAQRGSNDWGSRWPSPRESSAWCRRLRAAAPWRPPPLPDTEGSRERRGGQLMPSIPSYFSSDLAGLRPISCSSAVGRLRVTAGQTAAYQPMRCVHVRPPTQMGDEDDRRSRSGSCAPRRTPIQTPRSGRSLRPRPAEVTSDRVGIMLAHGHNCVCQARRPAFRVYEREKSRIGRAVSPTRFAAEAA